MVEQRQPKNNLNSQDSQVVTGNGAPNTDSTAVANPDTKTVAPLIDIERGVKGTVKWFSVMRGFGFIEREDKSGDVFVHSRAILKDNGQKLVSSLNEGEQVEFNVVKTDRGTEAREVTGPNGSTVQGSDFAPSLDELPRWLRHELFEYVIYGGGTGDRRGGGGYSNGNGSMTPNRRRNYDNGPASRRAADNRQTGPPAQTRNLRNRRPNNGRQGGQSDSVNDTQGRRDTQTRRDNQGQGGNPGNAQTKNTGDENQQPKPQRPRRHRRRSAAKGDKEGAGQRDTEGETTEGAAHGGDGNNRKGHDGRRRSAGKPKQTVVNDGAGDRTRAANGEAKVVDAAK